MIIVGYLFKIVEEKCTWLVIYGFRFTLYSVILYNKNCTE